VFRNLVLPERHIDAIAARVPHVELDLFDGGYLGRGLEVSGTSTVILTGLRIQRALTTEFGAGIYNGAGATLTLTVTDEAGNEARADFDHRSFPKAFKKSRIEVNDQFLDRVVGTNRNAMRPRILPAAGTNLLRAPRPGPSFCGDMPPGTGRRKGVSITPSHACGTESPPGRFRHGWTGAKTVRTPAQPDKTEN
jgi:hypothetical protein